MRVSGYTACLHSDAITLVNSACVDDSIILIYFSQFDTDRKTIHNLTTTTFTFTSTTTTTTTTTTSA
jgi:hypothetical protein